MIIRTEEPRDYEAVYHVIKDAFETAEERDGNEQDLVVALRSSEAFVPELSIVAEIDGAIVGHILFTKLGLAGNDNSDNKPDNQTANKQGGDGVVGDASNGAALLALAPLSVLPDYQQQGIGTALIEEGHRRARELGYGYSVVLGSATYYPRSGYIPADELGILPCFDVPRENFMACKLREYAPCVSGTVRYDKEFGIED